MIDPDDFDECPDAWHIGADPEQWCPTCGWCDVCGVSCVCDDGPRA